MELNQVQFTQLIEAINQPKTIVSLEYLNGLTAEIDKLKKKYDTGEKDLLETIAGYYINYCLQEGKNILWEKVQEEVKSKGFDLRYDTDKKKLQLIKSK